jgi:ketosteroid isomerase-like protein
MGAEQEITDLLKTFAETFSRRDVDAVGQTFARDDTLLFYGTHENIHFVGWTGVEASLRKQCELMDSIKVEIDTSTMMLHMLPGGQAACVAIPAMSFWGKNKHHQLGASNIRMTCVVERREGQWVFVQMHWSLPDALASARLGTGPKYW